MAVGGHCQMLPDEELVFWLASAHLAPRELAMVLQAAQWISISPPLDLSAVWISSRSLLSSARVKLSGASIDCVEGPDLLSLLISDRPSCLHKLKICCGQEAPVLSSQACLKLLRSLSVVIEPRVAAAGAVRVDVAPFSSAPIRTLDVSGSYETAVAVLANLASLSSLFPCLQHLALFYVHLPKTEWHSALMGGLSNLYSLSLSACCPSGLPDHLPSNLRELDLRGTEVHTISTLSACNLLEVLRIGKSGNSDAEINLDDLSVLEACPQLRDLELRDCKQLQEITILSELSQLQKLVITDACINNLQPLASLHQLATLDMSHCGSVEGCLRVIYRALSATRIKSDPCRCPDCADAHDVNGGGLTPAQMTVGCAPI